MAHTKLIAKWSLYLAILLFLVHMVNLLIGSGFLPIGGQFIFGKQMTFILAVILSLVFSVSILYREHLSLGATEQTE